MSEAGKPKKRKNPKAAWLKLRKWLYSALVVFLILYYGRAYLQSALDQYASQGNGVAQSQTAPAAPEIEYLLAGSSASKEQDANGNAVDHSNLLVSVKDPKTVMPKGFDAGAVPEYSGRKFFTVNGNVPFFTDAEMNLARKGAFEYYGPADARGRCTVAFCCLGRETMPPSGEKRGGISSVRPTGWRQARYDCVDSETVMTRAHLAAFILTAENANTRNLVTGTRYMNSDSMLIFETETRDWLYRNRRMHVLYRVTPVFGGGELMPRGVLMEARSVEDNGLSLQFCAYIYNVQPGLTFDYRTGQSSYTGIFFDTDSETVVTSGIDMILCGLDRSTGTVHSAFCPEYLKLQPSQKTGFAGDAGAVQGWKSLGYKLCGCLG